MTDVLVKRVSSRNGLLEYTICRSSGERYFYQVKSTDEFSDIQADKVATAITYYKTSDEAENAVWDELIGGFRAR